MKKVIFIFLLLMIGKSLLACTLFWADRNDKILCAKNMDWSNTATRMLILPASEGVYGRIYFGIEGSWGFTNSSGMNDQGLWYAGASLQPRHDVVNTYNKPESDYELVEKIMRECATVDEAIAVLTTYWEPHWNGHSLIADRFGNCMAVEYGEDDVVIIRNTKDYQIITNFYLIDSVNTRWTDCYRYQVADAMLKDDSTKISYEFFRDIADATHADGTGQTGLTTLHDLKNRTMRVFSMRNFEEYLNLDLSAQLAYGEHYVAFSDYFSGLRRLSPLEGENVPANNVELIWTGDEDEYLVRYGSDPDLEEYTEIHYEAQVEVQVAGMDWKVFILPFFSMVIMILKRRRVFMFFLVFISIFNTACYQVEIEPQYSKIEHSIVLNDQVPGTTLYWKVLSTGNGYNSETKIYQCKMVADEE